MERAGRPARNRRTRAGHGKRRGVHLPGLDSAAATPVVVRTRESRKSAVAREPTGWRFAVAAGRRTRGMRQSGNISAPPGSALLLALWCVAVLSITVLSV